MHTDKVNQKSVLFVGAPNSGKTTLYNWVTGSRYRTVNYPGATVDYALGVPLPIYGAHFEVIDTPGIYSLSPKTLEEEVTEKLIFNGVRPSENKIIVVVVDSTHFSRQVLLAEHLKECGFQIVIALTMSDILKEKGFLLNSEALSQELGVPVISIDGRLGGNVKELVQVLDSFSDNSTPIKKTKWSQNDYDKNFKKYDAIRENLIISNTKGSLPKDFNLKSSELWDRWILHPFWGLIIFFMIMFGMFSSVFWLATPAIDFVDESFVALSELLMAWAPGNLFVEFISSGLVAGVGAFAVFVPQIAILFLGLGILEDTGYLARASTLIDKPLSRLGLNGRSFVPILSSFACAVPGMLAARTIPNKNERFLTLFILPLMTCSARIPVYALLLTFIFKDKSPWLAGAAMAALYFASLLLGGTVAGVVNRLLPKSAQSFFLLEIPSYRRPVLRKTIKSVFDRTLSFVKRAGPVILVLSVVIWASSTFPNYSEPDLDKRFKSSYLTQAGQIIEPVFKPMGADWRVGIGILTSFAAREVFVSTLAVVFNVSEESDEALETSLLSKMQKARISGSDGIEGRLLFTPASVLALLIFFMIALQCLATVSVAKSEFGGWKMALIQLVTFNLAAYILAVGAYQLFS